MATNKTLKTRLALKIDTLKNWNESTLGLLKGEIAIATTAATAGSGLSEPVCMIKIGEDGVKTFSQLDWNFYAKASDVLAACKSETALTSFVENIIAGKNLATASALQGVANRVTKLEGDENTDGSVAKAIKDAIAALDLANTYAAKSHKHEQSDINGLGDALNSKVNKTDFETTIGVAAGSLRSGKTISKAIGDIETVVGGATVGLVKDVNDLKATVGGATDGLVKDVADLQAVGATKVEKSTTNGNIKINDTETVVYTHPETHTASEISDFATEVAKVEVNKAKYAENANTASVATTAGMATTATIANAVKNALSVTVGSNAAVTFNGSTAESVTINKTTIGLGNVDNTSDANKPVSEAQAAAIASALAEAKQYADDNDANTQYHVEYDSTNKKIKLVAGADASKMEIDATAFVKDGMISNVTIGDDNDLVITFNTDSGKEDIVVPLDQLVDIYTGNDGTTVKVTVTSDKKIEAEVKTLSLKNEHIATDAAISKSKLASDVQTSLGKADTAVQPADLTNLNKDSHTHDNKALLDTYDQTNADIKDAVAKKHEHSFVESELNNIKAGDVAKWNAAEANANDYTDDAILALDLGSMSKEIKTDYVKKTEAPGYDDILTKTEAQSAYQAKGNYKTTQTAVSDPTASGTDTEFIDSISQNANGVITATKKTITVGTGVIVDKAVTTEKINDAAVVTEKIADKNVTKDKLEDSVQTSLGWANTAIQNVGVVAGTGLTGSVSTAGNARAINIAFDDTVEFIFDCGDSSAR